MIRVLARWAAKRYYVLNQEFQAATADLHAGLSLKLAGEKRAHIEQLNKEADAIDANIKAVDEKLAKGYWECENGHEKDDALLSTSTAINPGASRFCLQCRATAKLVSLATMTGQEKYESDKERTEAQTISATKRAQAKAEEENVKGSEQTAKFFKDQAANNRSISQKIRTL